MFASACSQRGCNNFGQLKACVKKKRFWRMATAKFVDFLRRHGFVGFSFKQIQMELNPAGIAKKKPVGMPNWKKLQKTQVRDNDKAFAIRTGKESGVTVIDFDDESSYRNVISQFPELASTLTTKTARGYHVFCLYDAAVVTSTNSFGAAFAKVDIRNDDAIVFSYPTEYVTLEEKIERYSVVSEAGANLVAFPYGLKKLLRSVPPPKVPARVAAVPNLLLVECDQIASEDEFQTITELLDALPPKYATEYGIWYKIGAIVHRELGPGPEAKAVFLQFSRKGEGYANATIESLDEYWRSYSRPRKRQGATIGTLFEWCRRENPDAFNRIQARRFDVPKEPLFSEVFLEM